MEEYLAYHEQYEVAMQGAKFGHDLFMNNVSSDIYAHGNDKIITQDYSMMSDNMWFPNVDPVYTTWMKVTVEAEAMKFSFQIIRHPLWRKWFSRRYVIDVGKFTIDDGTVRLRGVFFLDVLICFYMAFVIGPPGGFLAFLKAIYDGVKKRMKADKAVEEAVELKETSTKED